MSNTVNCWRKILSKNVVELRQYFSTIIFDKVLQQSTKNLSIAGEICQMLSKFTVEICCRKLLSKNCVVFCRIVVSKNAVEKSACEKIINVELCRNLRWKVLDNSIEVCYNKHGKLCRNLRFIFWIIFIYKGIL